MTGDCSGASRLRRRLPGTSAPRVRQVHRADRRAPPENGTIRIIKDAVPNDDHVFNFTGASPIGTLSSRTGQAGAAHLQTHRPTQHLPRAGDLQDSRLRLAPAVTWTLAGIRCSNRDSPVPGPGVSITVGPGAVSCTFQNVRGDEPEPRIRRTARTLGSRRPEPVVSCQNRWPPPPTPPPSTQLRVVKPMPSVARVGRRMSFRLSVRNVGSVAARSVRMVDLPPAAGHSPRSGAAPEPALSPGRRMEAREACPGSARTVRGSVRDQGRDPGLKRNLIMATAINAQLVADGPTRGSSPSAGPRLSRGSASPSRTAARPWNAADLSGPAPNARQAAGAHAAPTDSIAPFGRRMQPWLASDPSGASRLRRRGRGFRRGRRRLRTPGAQGCAL